MIQGVHEIEVRMHENGYVSDQAIATSIFLLMELKKPILIEGHAGVGKTEIAKVLARLLGTDLIRLQCYEGLDASTALYEWNYARQLLHIRLQESDGHAPADSEAKIFSEPFLLKRPLLQAIAHEGRPPVLLVDEIDRSDEEFEAFLLEVLSDFQVTVPELGTIRARERPHVILTSNRSRELSDALRRRCLYLFIDHPPFEKELTIVRRKVPGASEDLGALGCVRMESRGRVYRARRCVLVARPEEMEIFDDAFAVAFSPPPPGAVENSVRVQRRSAPRDPAAVPSLSSWAKQEEEGGDGEDAEAVPAASDMPAVVQKDFSTFGADELADIQRIASRIARRLAARPSRRWASDRRGRRIDLRRTMRRALAQPLDLRFRRRKPRKTRIVAICDVSGSMDLYSRSLLHFLYALQGTAARVESFVFSTVLRRVTGVLRQPDYAWVLLGLPAEVHA